MITYVDEAAVRAVLTIQDAIQVVKRTFEEAGNGRGLNRHRVRVPLYPADEKTASRSLNLAAGSIPELGAYGILAYTGTRGWGVAPGPRFVIHLYDVREGRPSAVVEATFLTDLVTGASTAVATELMARPDSTSVGLIGAGRQARTQLEGIVAVLPIRSARVFSPTEARRRGFAEEMGPRLGIDVQAVASAQEAVRHADVVVTATTAFEPVLLGEWLEPGQHVNAIGANWPAKRELDSEAVTRMDCIAVDTLETAQVECGDLLYPIREGRIGWDRVLELGAIAVGQANPRPKPEALTLFESHGIALEYLPVAAKALELAQSRGLARSIDIL